MHRLVTSSINLTHNQLFFLNYAQVRYIYFPIPQFTLLSYAASQAFWKRLIAILMADYYVCRANTVNYRLQHAILAINMTYYATQTNTTTYYNIWHNQINLHNSWHKLLKYIILHVPPIIKTKHYNKRQQSKKLHIGT